MQEIERVLRKLNNEDRETVERTLLLGELRAQPRDRGKAWVTALGGFVTGYAVASAWAVYDLAEKLKAAGLA